MRNEAGETGNGQHQKFSLGHQPRIKWAPWAHLGQRDSPGQGSRLQDASRPLSRYQRTSYFPQCPPSVMGGGVMVLLIFCVLLPGRQRPREARQEVLGEGDSMNKRVLTLICGWAHENGDF